MKRSYSFFSSSPSSSKPPKLYDVFLSFRGEDTRVNFTGFLYHALHEKGIHTFLDDCGVERGKEVSKELLKTIEKSSCSIIIISTNYASSTWCLNELVKILDCKEAMGQIVLPIFYHVDPSHVRNKASDFGEAFTKHQQDFRDKNESTLMTQKERGNMEKVLKRWEDALTEVANIAGWHLSNRDNEAKFIHDFALEISRKYIVSRNIFEDLFGMDSRIKKLNSYVYKSVSGAQFIGICGMGGIGKTTLAKAFYNLMSSQFEGSSFLANVKDVSKEKSDGLKSLQEQLLSETLKGECVKFWNVHSGMNNISSRLCRKKVLIVIDDMDHSDQLKKLAGKLDWFGPGSKIIVTTRNENLLITHGVREIYKMELLDHDEAFQLFTWNAFKDINCPSDDYKMLSEKVMEYCNGLPLALEVLGRSLCGKSLNEWKSQLGRLKEYAEKEIIDVLQISFDGLEQTEKNIFLDIACFFKGYYKCYVIDVLDKCGFFPEIGIRNLIDKSLLSIIDDKFWMHDLLQEMGWRIVREKSNNELGRQSRLWNYEDISHVLENNMATEEVEAIACSYPFETRSTFKTKLNCINEAFSKMKKLRLLSLSGPNFLSSLKYLSNELRLIDWHACPLTCLPSTFQPTKLVELTLHGRSITRLWNVNIEPLYNLKIINLCDCGSLIKILDDFTVVPNLEGLVLKYCGKLLEIHPSIKVLSKLTLLDLTCCGSLDNFPTSLNGLESLEVLNLHGCSKLHELPKDIGNLKSLEELDVKGTGIRELPPSILDLRNLKELSCGNGEVGAPLEWKNMINTIFGKCLSSVGLYSLKKLDLNGCNLEEGAIPEEIGFLVFLEDLDLSYNNFFSLSATISTLSKLKKLCLEHCTSLRSLTKLPSSLEMVEVNKCTSLDTFLDPSEQCNLQCSAICVECFKLARRQGSKRTILTSLKRYLQKVEPNTAEKFEIVLPGCEIPNWFIHRNMGPWTSIKLNDPNWCDKKWLGLALCMCFISEDEIDFYCDVEINGQNWGLEKVAFPVFANKIKSYHLWLLYLPRNTYFRREWEDSCGHAQIDVSFQPYSYVEFDVKMCGARLVYEQDVHKFKL